MTPSSTTDNASPSPSTTVHSLKAHVPLVPWCVLALCFLVMLQAPEWHTIMQVLESTGHQSGSHTQTVLILSTKWLLYCSFFFFFFPWPIWQVESVKLVSSCRHGLTMEMNVKTFIFVRNYVKLFKFIGEWQQTSQLMNIAVICFLENTYGSEKIALQCTLPFWSKDVWREDRVCYSRT